MQANKQAKASIHTAFDSKLDSISFDGDADAVDALEEAIKVSLTSRRTLQCDGDGDVKLEETIKMSLTI